MYNSVAVIFVLRSPYKWIDSNIISGFVGLEVAFVHDIKQDHILLVLVLILAVGDMIVSIHVYM